MIYSQSYAFYLIGHQILTILLVIHLFTYELSSHWETFLLLLVINSFHHIINSQSAFDLLPIVKLTLLPGWEIQEITCRPVWLPVLPEQVKGTLDVRYQLGVKARFVIITGETDDTVYCLAEDITCCEQQEATTADKIQNNKGVGQILAQQSQNLPDFSPTQKRLSQSLLWDSLFLYRDPGGSQTHDLQNRNLTLYSLSYQAEMRGQKYKKTIHIPNFRLVFFAMELWRHTQTGGNRLWPTSERK